MFQLHAWLTSPITINQTYLYHGSGHELNARLRALDNSSFVEENYYRIDATISFGTMITTGALRRMETGIRLHMKILPGNESRQQINLYTKVRPENWLLLVGFTVIFSTLVMTGEKAEIYSYIAGVWITCFLWFNFIYKVQEWILLNKVVMKLGLREKITKR